MQTLWGMIRGRRGRSVYYRPLEAPGKVILVLVRVYAVFGLTVPDKMGAMCLRLTGAAEIEFAVCAAGQLYRHTHKFVYLGGFTPDTLDLTVNVARRVQRACIVAGATATTSTTNRPPG